MPDVDCGLCHASAIHISSALLSVSRKSWNLARHKSLMSDTRVFVSRKLVFTFRCVITPVRSALAKEARLYVKKMIGVMSRS